MPTCPLCTFANSSEAEACARCGKYRFLPGADSGFVIYPENANERTVRGPVTVLAPEMRAEPTTMLQAELPTVPPRLVVTRGMRVNMEYPIYDGRNFIGRSADQPADIDLTLQEPAEQVWASRQHAVILYERGTMVLEDLNSLNGTFVNRSRLHPGQRRVLQPNDVIAIGTVHLRVTTS